MGRGVARKLIDSHLVRGEAVPGSEIGLRIDQTLTQDATGTMVMLELEALDLERVRTEVSVQYVDHNLLQADERNMADHLFLRSACQRFGLWYSKAGNGVSHPTHMQRFGVPGASMVGSDSHTCAAGSLGMLAIGVGGIDVAMAMAGAPVYLTMPRIWGVRLTGELPAWVSAKDVILEMLRRHGVRGGIPRIIEYRGPGLAGLTAMDRHVIANMGAELGATTTVFPADELPQQHREAGGVRLRGHRSGVRRARPAGRPARDRRRAHYGQGSSREHAAIAPRYLGLRLVLARSYARIHWQNLVNFGGLPLEFADEDDYERVEAGDRPAVEGLHEALRGGGEIALRDLDRDCSIRARHKLSPRQVAMILAGGRIPGFLAHNPHDPAHA